ncbi:MAG: glycoside hydrolase, partial [Bacteroidaceae bacterium]|nr:glycoside hydrolase [Bacteroidaceae bacterium]
HRKDLRLYMSFDQGETWTEAFQLQPGYAAYSSMQKLDNGDLAIIYEDGSIGNKDLHDCYAINYVVISSETLNEKIDELYAESFASTVVKNTVSGSATGCDSYGSFTEESNSWYTTWTSNDASGLAGVTVVASGNILGYATGYNQRVMSLRPVEAGGTYDLTITAPDGYVIDSYSIGARNWSASQTYKLIDPSSNEMTTSTTLKTMDVENVNAKTSTFKFYGSSTLNFLCVTNFAITLKPVLNLNTVGDASYATLYLPFDVTLNDGTKAYYVEQVADGKAKLTELTAGIPAYTAAVLINSDAATSTSYTKASGLTPVVSEADNLLKGTLYSTTLDLSDETNYYSLGKLSDKIGFYKFQNGETTTITLGANKAYLEYNAGGGVKGFALDFGGATGVESVRNSELSDFGKETMFDLSGRRVSKPSHGIYVKNGQKVIIK